MRYSLVIALYFLLMATPCAYSQVSTEHFSLKSKCSLIAKDFNPKNKSYSYDIESSDGTIVYNVSVIKTKMGEGDREAYFNSIKSAGTLSYSDINFQGSKALLGRGLSDGLHIMHLCYIKSGVGIGVLLGADSKTELEKAYKSFDSNFSLKPNL